MNGQKTVFALVAVVYNIKSALIRISIAQLFNSICHCLNTLNVLYYAFGLSALH